MQESSEKTSSNQRGFFLKIWHQHNLPKVSLSNILIRSVASEHKVIILMWNTGSLSEEH